MHVVVLGAAAGGGFPQWNVASEACRRSRSGDPAARPSSQASAAISVDGRRWLLINASPDLRSQIEASTFLHPRIPPRSSPIAWVALTNADVDAIAGLLTLREGTPFVVLAHPIVHGILDRNPIFEVVARNVVERRTLELDAWHEPPDIRGEPAGFELRAFAAPGKLPLYLEVTEDALVTDATNGETLGLELRAGAFRAVWLANCARVTDAVRERVSGADLLFMDGTLWRDDELVVAGVSSKTGQRMGHVSMSGPEGAIARLADLSIGRRVFVHVNNSNPALLADSPERAILAEAGWEVAHDGATYRS